jgi:adenosylmethionine---8-amino-7-oxononanoate aminotransferase
MNERTTQGVQRDRQFLWHPFTEQRAWCAEDHEILLIERGEGVWLWDTEGRRYFDGNSSIWTNIHGHSHPHILAMLRQQMEKICHSSFLGFSHEPAGLLAERLCGFFPANTLTRVFYSDDGSTAIECAMKMALQYRMQRGEEQRQKIVAFANGYHGDTLGAASLGGVDLFFRRFRHLGMKVDFVGSVEELEQMDTTSIAAVVLEPMIQGVNEMRPWPAGMLRALRHWCDAHNVHLILDEVMTGFGRTGKMFACQHEDVIPDFLCLAKGLTGGYLPMAATLTKENIYEAFFGKEHVFYYGHSYTANPLGCAAALASLDVFATELTQEVLEEKCRIFSSLVQIFSLLESVREVRHLGMIAGVELIGEHGMGAAVCLAARSYGLLTRAIGNTVVLMPPLCATTAEIDFAVQALRRAITRLKIESQNY